MTKVFDSLKERRLKEERSDRNFLLVIAFVVAIALAIVLLNTYVLLNVEVVGESMRPTLESGDLLVVNRKNVAENGDIVIIDGEKNGAWLIKRVIAKGGQTVDIVDGYVFVDGQKISEDYVIREGITEKLDWEKRTLEEGEIFYLGDNREKWKSSDSRTEAYGTCREEQIVGVVCKWSLKYKSFNSMLYRATKGE